MQREAGCSKSEVEDSRLCDAENTEGQENMEEERGYSESEVEDSILSDAESTEQEHMEREAGCSES